MVLQMAEFFTTLEQMDWLAAPCVCNEHEWVDGKCDHEELCEEHTLPWFDRRDKDFEALQEVILDPGLLQSFKYYLRFR